MKYQKTPIIHNCDTLAQYQPGQWIQLAWCSHKSRLARFDKQSGNVTAFHFPGAASRFVSYFSAMRAADAFAAFNRHARRLSA